MNKHHDRFSTLESKAPNLQLGLLVVLVSTGHDGHRGTIAFQNSFRPVIGMDIRDAISFMHRLHLLIVLYVYIKACFNKDDCGGLCLF